MAMDSFQRRMAKSQRASLVQQAQVNLSHLTADIPWMQQMLDKGDIPDSDLVKYASAAERALAGLMSLRSFLEVMETSDD
jgi:hypothetical protein